MERQYLDRGYATTLAVCTCGFRELVPNVARGWEVLAVHAGIHGTGATDRVAATLAQYRRRTRAAE